MEHRRQRTASAVVVALASLASALAYPALPARMATLWNAAGTVDGTMPRLVGAFFVPATMVAVAGLLYLVVRIDPRRDHVEAFRGTYEWFVAGLLTFLAYVHGLVLLWNLGVPVPVSVALVPALSALVYGVGVLLGRTESNWFVGIRTPWTLSDEAIWERTHRRGARAFKLAGLLVLGGLLFPSYLLFFVLGPILAAAAYAVAYSFLLYRRKRRSARSNQ